MKTNHEQSSMSTKLKKHERQMTFWESDDCIVPLQLEGLLEKGQSSEVKLGNASVGKAVKPTREPRRTPATHSSGTPVTTRLERITQRAEANSTATYLTRHPIATPKKLLNLNVW